MPFPVHFVSASDYGKAVLTYVALKFEKQCKKLEIKKNIKIF